MARGRRVELESDSDSDEEIADPPPPALVLDRIPPQYAPLFAEFSELAERQKPLQAGIAREISSLKSHFTNLLNVFRLLQRGGGVREKGAAANQGTNPMHAARGAGSDLRRITTWASPLRIQQKIFDAPLSEWAMSPNSIIGYVNAILLTVQIYVPTSYNLYRQTAVEVTDLSTRLQLRATQGVRSEAQERNWVSLAALREHLPRLEAIFRREKTAKTYYAWLLLALYAANSNPLVGWTPIRDEYVGAHCIQRFGALTAAQRAQLDNENVNYVYKVGSEWWMVMNKTKTSKGHLRWGPGPYKFPSQLQGQCLDGLRRPLPANVAATSIQNLKRVLDAGQSTLLPMDVRQRKYLISGFNNEQAVPSPGERRWLWSAISPDPGKRLGSSMLRKIVATEAFAVKYPDLVVQCAARYQHTLSEQLRYQRVNFDADVDVVGRPTKSFKESVRLSLPEGMRWDDQGPDSDDDEDSDSDDDDDPPPPPPPPFRHAWGPFCARAAAAPPSE